MENLFETVRLPEAILSATTATVKEVPGTVRTVSRTIPILAISAAVVGASYLVYRFKKDKKMKTEITKTAYTVRHGGKHCSTTCDVCGTHLRSYASIFSIRGEKMGVYCSPQCIDRIVQSRNSQEKARIQCESFYTQSRSS